MDRRELIEEMKEIIKESISSVICIDDKFPMPYKDNENVDSELANKLYYGLMSSCNCTVDIRKYSGEVAVYYKNCFNKKDMVILDWELDDTALIPYEVTLKLLELINSTEISFICIYTQEPYIENINKRILSFFSGYTKELLGEFYSKIEDIIDIDSIKDSLIDCFENSENLKCIIEKITPNVRSEMKENNLDINYETFRKIYYYILLMDDMYAEDKNIIVKRIFEGKKTTGLNMNGKIILIFNKESAGTNLYVKPDDLLDKFSINIANSPNNIFNVVWLQFKNHFKRILYKQGSFFQEIDETTFIYHNQQIRNESEEIEQNAFDNFIKEFYKDELIAKLNDNDCKTGKKIFQYINEQEEILNPSIDELVKLNYFYSINKEKPNEKRQIQFGDIFYCSNNIQKEDLGFDNNNLLEIEGFYFLCITAHCDCLRPQKINSNYIFLKGEVLERSKSALNNPEGDGNYYSFVKTENGFKAIKWELKLIQIYIEGNSYILTKNIPVTGYYKSCKFGLDYMCNLKENYSQRIANAAFSFANRVGITYGKLPVKKEREEKIYYNKDINEGFKETATAKDM